MQRCPKCNRTYQDDKQKFCTHDGGRLEPYEPPLNEAPTSFDLGATMRTDVPSLGETLLNQAAAELNRTMAAPPPPPQPTPKPPPLNKTIAVPSPPQVNPPQPAPPPPQSTPTYQPQAGKTIVAQPQPPPQQQQPTQTGEIRPTGTMPTSSQTSELSPPHDTMGFPPAAATTQPPWPPAPQQQPAPVASSGPVAPPGASQSQPLQPAPPLAVGHITQPVKKSSRLPLILGGLIVLLLVVGGAAVVAYVMYSRSKSEPKTDTGPSLNSNVQTERKDVANANANTAANTNTSSFAAPPNSLKFTNSRAKLDGKLAEHYADFSFYYPKLWTMDPKSGVSGASNFVKVDRIVPPNITQESFAVSWYDSHGTMDADRASFPALVNQLSSRLSGSFQNYQKVSEGDTEINSYKGHEFRFKSVAEGTDRGDVTAWGRVIFLPPGTEGDKNGLVLLMFTTSVAADLDGVEDVGKKGELAMIIDTFRLGSNP
jgi:hypothetical protein